MSSPAVAPSTSAIPGFSGFGHVTEVSVTVPAVVAVAPAAAPVAEAKPFFSGFSHFSGQMGGNPALGKAFVAPSPAVATPAPGPATLAFSGFGHFSGQMGGNPSLAALHR